jgi:hypothetical protein
VGVDGSSKNAVFVGLEKMKLSCSNEEKTKVEQ